MIEGSLLKEAIEDLEWVAGSGAVTLTMHRQPPSVSLAGHSAGSLEVKILVQPTHTKIPAPVRHCV